jgi:XTP/dITP diphosphohydrolase
VGRWLAPGPLVVASHNAGKVREIGALLGPYGIEPISAGALGLPEPDETETSFIGNAKLKALAAARATGMVALADDSGLCVDALGGAPGIYTANWAERQPFEGPQGRDWYLAMGKVEGKLAELGPDVSRAAQFVCVLALAWPDGFNDDPLSGYVEVFEGRVAGQLVWPPRGRNGFGYDPVFQPMHSPLTFGEMEPDAKHAINHRAHAFAQLVAACLTR